MDYGDVLNIFVSNEYNGVYPSIKTIDERLKTETDEEKRIYLEDIKMLILFWIKDEEECLTEYYFEPDLILKEWNAQLTNEAEGE